MCYGKKTFSVQSHQHNSMMGTFRPTCLQMYIIFQLLLKRHIRFLLLAWLFSIPNRTSYNLLLDCSCDVWWQTTKDLRCISKLLVLGWYFLLMFLKETPSRYSSSYVDIFLPATKFLFVHFFKKSFSPFCLQTALGHQFSDNRYFGNIFWFKINLFFFFFCKIRRVLWHTVNLLRWTTLVLL